MKNFEMTHEQLDVLMESVPLIALQCGMPASPQERVNVAWEKLGKEMGFKHMTVKPFVTDPHFSRLRRTDEKSRRNG